MIPRWLIGLGKNHGREEEEFLTFLRQNAAMHACENRGFVKIVRLYTVKLRMTVPLLAPSRSGVVDAPIAMVQ